MKTYKHELGINPFKKKDENLVDISTTFGDPNHHQDTKPNVGSPRHHLVKSNPSKSPSPNINHQLKNHQFKATKDELQDKGMAHSDTND